jgi:phage tail tube protein FII
MPGSVSIDLGLDDDALSLEWTLGGLPDVALWAQYASPVPTACRCASPALSSATTPAKFLPLRWSCVAVTEYDGGENKQGESGTTKIATECSYYQLTIDGKGSSKSTSSTW